MGFRSARCNLRIVGFLFVLCLFACASPRRAERFFRKSLKAEVETSTVFARGLTGFELLDAASGRRLCAVHADRYFTPASTTKILTLATCLNVLGDSLPGLKYEILPGKVLFSGTGDPTLLNHWFMAWQPAIQLFEQHSQDTLAWVRENFENSPLGPGWAWDDAWEDYSADRSGMPVYGNLRRVFAVTPDSLAVEPDFYTIHKTYSVGTTGVGVSADGENLWYGEDARFPPDFEAWFPFRHTAGFEVHHILLGRRLKRYIGEDSVGFSSASRILYSTPVDTVYRRMMYQSDNFVAEQLLLACAGTQFDTLKQEKIIAWAKDSLFRDSTTPPRWVDGSGLSRYNLVTPHYLGLVLHQLYQQQPRERLFNLFPAGGASGTLSNWYRGPDGQPFVFAKSGSMSGVQCLSGYLVAKSGRVLIFTFMHNNFVGSGKPWKAEMQRLLLEIREKG